MRPLLFVVLMIGSPLVTLAEDRDELLQIFVDELVEITPGRKGFERTFEMGSQPLPEGGGHTVRFDYDFAIAKYEVPQNLYEAVMGQNPSRWKGRRNAVEMVSWKEANEFCERLTRLLRGAVLIPADQEIRLPSEAEWEYCCRAGTNTAYSFGDQAQAEGDRKNAASVLDPYAWHTGNAAGNDPPVGALKPNLWGLYDMHGYLWEFTADAWTASLEEVPTDGSPRTAKKDSQEKLRRVVRGGSWKDRFELLQSSSRRPIDPDARSEAVGFRCVRGPSKTD